MRHLLLFAAALAACSACSSTPPATPAPPRSFPDAVALDNGVVRLEVSPAVGRVVSFGPAGGRNLIWIAPATEPLAPGEEPGYDNVGGDKLWPTSQMLWQAATGNTRWPPDGVIDGAAWELVVADGERIVIRSPESAAYGAVVTREFRLEDGRPRAVLRNTLLRTAANPFPLSAWTVTQVQTPDTAVLDAAGDRPAGTPASVPLTESTAEKTVGRLDTPGGGASGAVTWEQAGPAHAKLGSYGRWVAAVYDDLTFLQSTAYDPEGGYLDASSVQVYRAAAYLELELWSPLAQLRPGEELSNEVVWELLPTGGDAGVGALMRRDAAGEP